MSTLDFSKRIEMEDYPCFPTGVWRVQAEGTGRELTFNGADIRQTPNGLFLRHGNTTQKLADRRLSFMPWWRVQAVYQVEGQEGE
jgi:hypothetical protein